jgi:hypothetical protein
MSGTVVAESTGIVLRFLAFMRRQRVRWRLDLGSPPDADVLYAVLEVEKRAAMDGRHNLPSSSEIGLTGSQRDIVDFHRKLQDKARGRVEKLAAKLTAAAKRVEPSDVANRLRDIPSKCRNRIDRLLVEFESKGALPPESEESAQQHRDDHGEHGSESESGQFVSKAIYFVTMLAVLGMTALALGSNFLWGARAGSLLGTDPAFAIAAIAVVLPFMVAVSVSNPTSAPLDRERPAFRITVLLTTAFLSLLALFCGHLIIGSANAEAFSGTDFAVALNAMISDPGAIGADPNALKGFGIVLVMGLLAFLLGNQAVSTDDVSSSNRAAGVGNSKHGAERLRKRINGIVDAAEKEVNRSVKRLQKQHKKLSGLAEQANNSQVLYDDFLAGLEESCNLLLERYREVNTARRKTDVPPSFAEQICFRLEGASRKLFFEDGIQRQRKSDDEMNDLYDTVAEIRRNLRDLNRVAIRSLDAAELHEQADKIYAHSPSATVSG